MDTATRVSARGVVPIAPGDAGEAADSIARAFADNEVWAWMIPSERRRLRVLRRYYRFVIKRLFIPGEVAWMSADRRASALWVRPGQWPRTRAQQRLEVLALLPWCTPADLARGARIEALFHEHHPREPHWYLNTLTVDPALQRSGYGTALLEAGLERCDADGLGSYLETQRESNVPYYARFGYELCARPHIPGGPQVWMMWRDPR